MIWQNIIDYWYNKKENATAREILIEHSRAVANFATELNIKYNIGLDDDTVVDAAMLHDIGIIKTNAPGIGCFGDAPYICHGVLGADMLRSIDAPEWVARVAERHTGSGLTTKDIINQKLPLPTNRVLTPENTLEKLICYADKFFSKKPGKLTEPKSLEQVRKEMSAHGPETLERFERLLVLP